MENTTKSKKVPVKVIVILSITIGLVIFGCLLPWIISKNKPSFIVGEHNSNYSDLEIDIAKNANQSYTKILYRTEYGTIKVYDEDVLIYDFYNKLTKIETGNYYEVEFRGNYIKGGKQEVVNVIADSDYKQPTYITEHYGVVDVDSIKKVDIKGD